MASAILQRSVRPREEDETLEESPVASEQGETPSASGDEDKAGPLTLSRGPGLKIQPESPDEDVRFHIVSIMIHF